MAFQQFLTVSYSMFADILTGKKTAIFNVGAHFTDLGDLTLICESDCSTETVDVRGVLHTILEGVTLRDAQACGYETLDELYAVARELDPSIKMTDYVTVITFRLKEPQMEHHEAADPQRF